MLSALTPTRDLPWRRTRDPWAVLVSETMLQQTQVARVVPRWEAFITRWSDPASCAEAGAPEVVRAWAGLGYNRRALNLHRCAVALVERHAGVVPHEMGALLALPGVGAYTARALLAFAFERDVAVIDVNTARVMTRAVFGRRPRQEEADALVPAGEGWRWNQAMLDLGATVCTARAPACPACPLRPACAWAKVGGPDPAARGPRQARFEGSDRQGRGRLVDALRAGPVSPADLAGACGWPDDPGRAVRVASGLVRDGLVVATPTGLRLG